MIKKNKSFISKFKTLTIQAVSKNALNMYCQTEYVRDRFVKQYNALLQKHADEISALQQSNTVLACYGYVPLESIPTKPTDFIPECNDIFHNEDLHGYYELYKYTSPLQMAENLMSNNIRELSPFEALFLLEFQMKGREVKARRESLRDLNNITQEYHLEYIPHRFYHRYAHSSGDISDNPSSNQEMKDSSEKEKEKERKRKKEEMNATTTIISPVFDKKSRKHEFESILRNNPMIHRIYFAFLSKERSHAFAAIKLDTYEYNRIIHTSFVYMLWLCFVLHLVFYSASPKQPFKEYLVYLLSYVIFTLQCGLIYLRPDALKEFLPPVYKWDDLIPMLKAAVISRKPNELYEDGYWVLLDSLKSKPTYKGGLDALFDETEMDGPCYASVMIVQDYSGKRLTKVFRENN